MDFSELTKFKEVFLRLLQERNFARVKMTNDKINFTCPHCDDRLSKKSMGRGFLIIKQHSDGGWMPYYKCHNGDCAFNHNPTGAITYLKNEYPEYYEMYKRATSKNKHQFQFRLPNSKFVANQKSVNTDDVDWAERERLYKQRLEDELSERIAYDKTQMQHFIPITEHSSIRTSSIRYLEKRNIPQEIWKRFFVCTVGKYKHRIIIPYFRKDKKPNYFQARALYEFVTPKYLNKIGHKQIYNIDFVDNTRPVFVFEGLFDSIFVNNAIAVGGVSLSDESLKRIPKEQLYIMLDNDIAGRKTSARLLEDGYPVFDWPTFLAKMDIASHLVKDWNDLVTITKKTMWLECDLMPYFTHANKGHK